MTALERVSLEVESFDGWDAPDLIDWLTEACSVLSAAEKWTDGHRMNVGRALHQLRDELPEGEYGRVEEALAHTADVTARTLRNWRAAYEDRLQLPPARKALARTEARKARTQETFPKSAEPIEATATPVPNASLDLEQPEPGQQSFSLSSGRYVALSDGEARELLRLLTAHFRAKPAASGCTHPKDQRRVLPYATLCGSCGEKVR